MARRSANERRARLALAWTAGLFLATQLAGGLLLDYVWPALRFPSAAHVFERVADGRRPAIVCLGSSRFAHGLFEPEVCQALAKELGGAAPDVFNAAVPAGDQVSSDYLLKELLRRGVRPRLAIVEVTPESLNHYNTWLNIHVQRQLRWEDLPRYGADIIKANQLMRLLKARVLPLYLHRRQLWRESWEAVRPLDEAPTEAIADAAVMDLVHKSRADATPDRVDATMHGASQVPRWLRNYRVGGTAAAALERVLRTCDEHGIGVVLVAPPVTAAHRAAYTPAIDAAFTQSVEQAAAAHHCPFVSYRDRLSDDLFLDNHHLLPKGGQVWSAQLATEVIAPAWQALPARRIAE